MTKKSSDNTANIEQEPIKADTTRQATDPIEGYRYQILHSVNAWLDLADNDILYLEVAEDFDIESDGTFKATQVKHTQNNITLRSQQVIDGINNYWELRTNNRDRRVRFRLLTKSKIVEEQGNPLGMDKPGLEVWSRCSGNEAAIKKISDFLQTDGKISDEVNDFLKIASPQEIYEHLIEPITWDTDCKPSSFVEQSIREKLVYHGDRHGISPSKAKDIIEPLITETWKIAGQPENRELTRLRFLEIFEEKTKRLVSEQYLQHMEMLAAMKGAVRTGFAGGSFDITIESCPHIQTGIPLLYLDVVIPRTELLTRIQDKLQSEGIAIIQGGVDKGKTTLANLTANAIDGKWFWLKLTNIDSSQVPVILKKLANTVRHESAQVNVVIDDLNLQPQQLQAYEEDLGVVTYTILERGAKLLITSQYNPPNDLLRSLGLSLSVVVPVSHFTISEIEQFAAEMGCSAEHAKIWLGWVQFHTKGHPRLVHTRLTQLQQEDWKYQGKIESILRTPQEVVKEREEARQLLMGLSQDQRKFLYRLSLLTEFRKDYSLNIGEIPEPISDPGDVFSQLVGPWIDQVSETYYTISPLLKNAANEVWSKNKISALQAEIANAILKTKNLTPTEAWAVFTHSIAGQNKEGIIAFIYSLMNAPQDDWKNVCQEFSLLAHIKIDPPEELFPGNAFVNQMFRLLQYRIAVEVEPKNALKILEILDKEIKPYEPYKSYLLSRLMLATQALMYYQVLLPAKQMVAYLREMIDITNNLEEVQEIYNNSVEEFKKHKTDKSNFFSILFGFIYARRPIYAPFLSELVDAVDELPPEIRTLLLADFEDDTIDSRVLIDGIWRSEADLENPDWTRCLQVFDKVIERTIAWDYPHLAAAAARGKATIYDEYLNEPDTAHEVIQDFVSKARPSPIVEEQQAVIYLHQKRYKEALSIYERILPKWDPPAGQLDVMPSVACRRAAICAAHLGDWKKAAAFLEDGAQRTHKTMNIKRHIGFCADAGFAHFKAGNMLNCIKLLHLALGNFEKLPEDNTDVKYFTLKKRLEYIIKWIWMIWCGLENNASELSEPTTGFCSDPETNEKILDFPDSPIGYSWLCLAEIEYRFGHETTIFQHALQTSDREEYPIVNFLLSILETKYDFRNQTFDNLPQRVHQLANACQSIQGYQQNGIGIKDHGINTTSIPNLPDFTSIENITIMFIASLLVQLLIGVNTHEILTKWRANSSQLPIKENMTTALNLIDRMLSTDENNALKVMKTQDIKPEERLTAALKVVHNIETSPENLFHAHILITTYLINNLIWLDPFMTGLAVLLSGQWLKKIKFRAALKMPMVTVPEIEQACKSSETGKKKIGQILLAAHPAVSTRVAPDTLQQFRSWTESDQKHAVRKNPAAQRLIKAMEKPPHLTDEDIEALNQSIKEGEIPIRFDSIFEPDESEKE
ncbi:MAG: hypothetical protein OXU51_06720 [Candidatus Poribacteria bacterium]|nr:hypothetical protein [Candidatus Poribacteria bacterium]